MHGVPSLVDLCIQVAIDNVRYLRDVGETDFHLLERILPHCTLDQLMHIENTTKGRDLSPVTDGLWEKFYVRQFGIESANLVIERMGQKRVIFKWKQLYEAKLKDREEATQKSLDRIKKRYQEEDAKPEGFPNHFFIPSSILLQKQQLSLLPCPPSHPQPTTPTPPQKLWSSPLCPEVTSFTSDQCPPSHLLSGSNYLQWAQSIKIVICA